MTRFLDNHPAEHTDAVHLPKPSFAPLVFGLGFALIVFGLILAVGPHQDDLARARPDLGILLPVSGTGLLLILIAVGG